MSTQSGRKRKVCQACRDSAGTVLHEDLNSLLVQLQLNAADKPRPGQSRKLLIKLTV